MDGAVDGGLREWEEMDFVIRDGDGGIILPSEPRGRRLRWERSTEKMRACSML